MTKKRRYTAGENVKILREVLEKNLPIKSFNHRVEGSSPSRITIFCEKVAFEKCDLFYF